MKNIVIAAGYATRLYPLTKNFPKPLLTIGSNTILGRLIDDIDAIPEITAHIIVSNHKFVNHFESWASKQATPKACLYHRRWYGDQRNPSGSCARFVARH